MGISSSPLSMLSLSSSSSSPGLSSMLLLLLLLVVVVLLSSVFKTSPSFSARRLVVCCDSSVVSFWSLSLFLSWSTSSLCLLLLLRCVGGEGEAASVQEAEQIVSSVVQLCVQ